MFKKRIEEDLRNIRLENIENALDKLRGRIFELEEKVNKLAEYLKIKYERITIESKFRPIKLEERND